MSSTNNTSLGFFAIKSAVAVAAFASCLLLIPRVRAFVPIYIRGASNGNKSTTARCLSAKNSDDNGQKYNCMPVLPPNVVKYSQVPKTDTVFTSQTLPSGLLKQHNTKKGTLGVIRVFRGQLEYTIHEPQPSVYVLDENNFGVIEPTMLHQVKALSEDVEFVVEFWRVPGTGVVDEKREGLNEK